MRGLWRRWRPGPTLSSWWLDSGRRSKTSSVKESAWSGRATNWTPMCRDLLRWWSPFRRRWMTSWSSRRRLTLMSSLWRRLRTAQQRSGTFSTRSRRQWTTCHSTPTATCTPGWPGSMRQWSRSWPGGWRLASRPGPWSWREWTTRTKTRTWTLTLRPHLLTRLVEIHRSRCSCMTSASPTRSCISIPALRTAATTSSSSCSPGRPWSPARTGSRAPGTRWGWTGPSPRPTRTCSQSCPGVRPLWRGPTLSLRRPSPMSRAMWRSG